MASCEFQAEFVQRLRAGDQDVLEAILRAYGPAVRAVLRDRFRGPLTDADFEDVLATALFRLWQSRARFDPGRASLRVWFFRIAVNVARDVLKVGWHKARQLEVVFEPQALAEVIDGNGNHNDDDHDAAEVPTAGSRGILQELLALLPESQRRIVLADAASRDGIAPSRELADELGIPAATVRVYRRRALERLRREFEGRQ